MKPKNYEFCWYIIISYVERMVKNWVSFTILSDAMFQMETSRLFGWHILAYLDLSWLISSHRILFILPAEHYSFYQPNTLIFGE
jgi:hypothetical protein